MGGTYNEPNTNLTGAETAIRNFVHGIGFQRDVLGANPATAWQLDVFGHDPQFLGMAADAGLTSSGWARGPHHQWGPMAKGGRRPASHAVPQRVQGSRVRARPADALHARALRRRLVDGFLKPRWPEGRGGHLRAVPRAESVALTRNVLLPVSSITITHPAQRLESPTSTRDWNALCYTWRGSSARFPQFFARCAPTPMSAGCSLARNRT